MLWVLVIAGWLGLAALTSRAARERDHDPTLWFVLGLVFPGAALAALLLGYPRSHSRVGELSPDVAQALRGSRVARALRDQPGLDEEGLRQAAGVTRQRVGRELRSLRGLGLVRRGQGRTWTLAPTATAVLADDESRPERPGGPDAEAAGEG